WVLFVNVPIGIAIALLAPLYINESERHPGRFDLTGACTATAGMVSLVYGFIRASDHGWTDAVTVTAFGLAIVLLAAFLANERRVPQPITPPHLFRDRNRSGAYGLILCVAATMFGIFFFLTLFAQDILGYSPLRAGFAFLPISVAIIAAAQFAARTQLRFGAKPFLMAGSLLVVAGVAWATRISVHSSYADGILGPTLLFGLGMGSIFVPATLTVVSRVAPHETGAATGMLNTSQQVGGSLGLSILVTVYGTASRHETARQVPAFLRQATPQELARFRADGTLPAPYSSEVLAHGIATAFQLGLVFAALAVVIAVFVIRVHRLPASAPVSPAGHVNPAGPISPSGDGA
ncbi:MFS transporter, partial [Streptomyces sp. FH025]|uniref:MFS transporter n=1 Tax=Streptomyces sp. FH025 TaxID=2815937 RepID=UPI001A9EB2A0